MNLLAAVNWHSVLFMLFALLACVFALAVVFSQNVVRMAFYLVLSLASTAGLFMLAGAEFVGAMQIMIYVGGTLVLLVFGVMLTAQSTFVSMKTSAPEWLLAALVGGSLLYVLFLAAFGTSDWTTARKDQQTVSVAESKAAAPIGLGLLGIRVDSLSQPNETLKAGQSGYLLAFEIVSVHLLVVLIGAAYLARTKRRRQEWET
ncbi:MAG: NADH-quinone oxidoreductase subunit J [Pirellulaceae bacterium]|nr:NADH-quinone oxidoreductase subunit J [Planctomycetales bacterium]